MMPRVWTPSIRASPRCRQGGSTWTFNQFAAGLRGGGSTYLMVTHDWSLSVTLSSNLIAGRRTVTVCGFGATDRIVDFERARSSPAREKTHAGMLQRYSRPDRLRCTSYKPRVREASLAVRLVNRVDQRPVVSIEHAAVDLHDVEECGSNSAPSRRAPSRRTPTGARAAHSQKASALVRLEDPARRQPRREWSRVCR